MNKEKQKEYQKQWYQNNKERVLEESKQYYLDNKERVLEYAEQYRLDNKEKQKEYQKQWYQDNKEKQNEYYQDNKEKQKEYQKQWYQNNKEEKKEWYQNNKERVLEYDKQYRLDNKERIKEYKKQYNKQYQKEQYNSDPLFKFKNNCRSRTRQAFKRNSWKKNGGTEKLLGCDWKTAMNHIESQFEPWMNWDNHGEWEIDHIIPLALANTKEEMNLLFNYKNLQPLLAEDNRKKGDRVL
jgi:hypothetical protein